MDFILEQQEGIIQFFTEEAWSLTGRTRCRCSQEEGDVKEMRKTLEFLPEQKNKGSLWVREDRGDLA